MKKNQGFTLIELLITILIMSILASVAGPSFMDSFDRNKGVSTAEELYSYLQLARSEALTRSTETNISFSGSATSWAFGISAGTSCDPSKTSNTDASACVFEIDDGNGSFSAASDNVIFRVSSDDHDDVKMAVVGGNGSFVFDPVRGTTDQAGTKTIRFTTELGNVIYVKLSKIGNAKICSDDLGGYSSC